jgi:hypothetical protein
MIMVPAASSPLPRKFRLFIQSLPGRRKLDPREPALSRLHSAEQLFDPFLIKANDSLAVDDDHGGRHNPQFFKLIDGRWIFRYVLFLENNCPLRKELLRSIAE